MDIAGIENMKIINSRKYIIFSLLAITIIILLRNIEISKMWAFGDLTAIPSNSKLMVDWILYSWKDEGMGLPNSPIVNHYILMLLSSYIFGNILGQKILFLSALPISFFSSYYFLNYFKFRSNISLVGSLIYSFNPVTISCIVGGSAGELMTYAIFPFFIIFIYKLISDEKFDIKYVSIIIIMSLFLLNVYVAFWYSLLAIIPMLFILFRGRIRNLLRLVLPISLLSILFLPILLGLINLSSGISKEEVSFIPMVKYTYNDISIPNIIRLSGNKGSAQNEEFLDYNRLNHYTILGYIPSILAFLSIFFILFKKIRNKEKNIVSLILYGLISFLIITVILLLMKNYPNLVDSSIILSTLRNPMKLIYPLVLPFVILFCCSMSILFDEIKDNRIKMYIMSLLVVIIVSYNYPALDGTLGLMKVLGEQYFVEDKYYQLNDIMNNIDSRYNESSILFLPWEYITNLRIRGVTNNYFGTNLGAQTVGINISKFEEIFNVMINKDSKRKYEIFSLFNVKYVIIDKTFTSDMEKFDWYKNLKKYHNSYVYYSHNSYWIIGDPAYLYSIFNKDKNFKLTYEDENFAIFKNSVEPRKFFAIDEKYDFRVEYLQISDNLVKNPSFENNTSEWSIWKGESIKLSNDSKEGNNSIILFGQDEWWSTIFQIFYVKNDVLYELNYYVKSYNITDTHSKIIWYNQTKKLGEGDGFSSDYVSIYKENLTEGEWYKIDKIFSSPKDIKMARIEFKGNRLINYTNTSTFIDGISFYEISPEIVDIPHNSKKIDFVRINPTLYKIKLNNSSPFILGFVESYNPSWEAIIYKDNKIINKAVSIPLYSIINGFDINDTGNIDIIIRYKPQHIYEISLVVSTIIYIICVLHILYSLKRKIK